MINFDFIKQTINYWNIPMILKTEHQLRHIQLYMYMYGRNHWNIPTILNSSTHFNSNYTVYLPNT